jgi:RHS repeat-associated protein
VNSIATTLSLDNSGTMLTSTAFSGETYYPGGAVETAKLAIDPTSNVAGVALSRTYDNRGRITGEVDTDSLSQSAYHYSLSYDANSNVTTYNDSVTGSWTATYDALHRWVKSTGTMNGVAATFQQTYDHFGNRNVEYFTYNGTETQPSPYLNFTTGSNRVVGSTYDNAGNLYSDGTNDYLYDAENRLCAVKQLSGGDSIGYVYAANGPRLGRGNLTTFSCDVTKNGLLTANGLALTNAYMVGPQGERLEETDGNFNMLHYNVFWEGKLLGTFTGTTYVQSNWHFALNDWLGTKREITTSAGAPWTSLSSGPFGDYVSQTGSGSNPSEEFFTGKVRDTESGLDDFLARHYSSNWGRFLSPDDGRGQVAEDPQSWNLYSYVQNNPLINVDPDGHDCVTQSRVDSSSESVSVSSGGCSGVAGNGTTQTYVNGSVSLSDIHTGADGHSIDIGFTGADGSTGVQNADSAPTPDNPGISLGNNQAGMFQMSGTNRVVNQIGGAIFGAESFFMGGLLGGAAPEATLGVGKPQVNFSNALAHNITALRGDHLPPPGSVAEIRQAVTAALNAGQYSTKGNGAIEGTVTIQGVQCGFRGALVNGVMRISTVFANR